MGELVGFAGTKVGRARFGRVRFGRVRLEMMLELCGTAADMCGTKPEKTVRSERRKP